MLFVPSPTPDIIVSLANRDTMPKNLDDAAIAKFHPSTFVITNGSDRSVVGLVVRWVYTDRNGRPGTLTHTSDGFLLSKARVVLSPRARLLVAPGVFLQESLLRLPTLELRSMPWTVEPHGVRETRRI